MRNLFSSFPQDAEISAFELRSILNKILAKRECFLHQQLQMPPAGFHSGHGGREGTADLGRVRAGLCPRPAAWLSIWPRPCALSAASGGCRNTGAVPAQKVSHKLCALAGYRWVSFIPASATGNWLPGRGMDLNNP